MKRISFLVIIIALFFIIIRLGISIYTLWHKQDLLISAQNQLRQEQQENAILKKQLAKTKSPQFIDEEARNKLLLVKPGESEVLIDPSLIHSTSSPSQDINKPLWKQWLSLFF